MVMLNNVGLLGMNQKPTNLAQKTVDKQILSLPTANLKAFQKLCKQDFACEADAQKALIAFDSILILTEVVDGHIIEV
jgi:hypothetical protein